MQLCQELALSNKKAVLKTAFHALGLGVISVRPRSLCVHHSDRNARKRGGIGGVHRNLHKLPAVVVTESGVHVYGFYDLLSAFV